VSDRIRLAVTGDDRVQGVIEHFGERIAAETLAVAFAGGNELPYQESFEVDGVTIDIALGKA
jgi:hypothetical protein